MIKFSDHDDLWKTRKSIYATSAFTIIVANAEFLSDSMNIFGLEVAIRQDHLVVVGQISVVFLLIMFCLHASSDVLRTVIIFFQKADERWNEAATQEISEIEAEIQDPGYYEHEHYNGDPWEEAFWKEQVKRKTRLGTIEKSELIFNAFKKVVTNYAMVFSVSLLTIFSPTSLGKIVSFFEELN